jgi:hypothetical protein
LARSIDRDAPLDDDRGDLPVVIGTLTPTHDDRESLRDDPRLRSSRHRMARSTASRSTMDSTSRPTGSVLGISDSNSYPRLANQIGAYDGYYEGPILPDAYGEPYCDPCFIPPPPCPPYRCVIYGRAEYLLWWLSGSDTPPLVTTSPQGTPAAQAGVLGQPGTAVLFGGQGLNTDPRSGGRVTLGGWFNQATGLEGEYFMLADSNQSFGIASSGNPIIARPFFNVPTNTEASQVLAITGAPINGSISVFSTSSFQGASIYMLRNLLNEATAPNRVHRLDFQIGFSYLNLRERLTIVDSFVFHPETNAANFTLARFDEFKTTNIFNGLDLGVQGEHRLRRFSINTTGRVGLGSMSETVFIDGSSTLALNNGTPPKTFPGGFLALPTNMGNYHRNVFAVVPRLGIKLGYNVLTNLKLHVGYDLIYTNTVVRPGNQIDFGLNTSQALGNPLVGPARPAPFFNSSDLFVQGLDAGAELRF